MPQTEGANGPKFVVGYGVVSCFRIDGGESAPMISFQSRAQVPFVDFAAASYDGIAMGF
jgi:hypothetical protein